MLMSHFPSCPMPPETLARTSETAILDRLLRPRRADLPPEAARALLALDFEPADRRRMDALAAQAREGALSAADREELLSYLHVGHLLALLKSRARTSLQGS